ncbi:1,4-dihydroxy-2-naphthoate octaprenyltransferase [Fluviicola taffensis]|uniref:1,4-dihydroxy-2-naphthoate octaprenyltransferase n=1 Tax=Fluviicola taffensis (strain DSM 16823 / NCIMB 13979 / RW262) TaxID=755732 RepID=F2IBY0_FLUTR|nr:1,4-dihydroxy-2-naphthoate octaprenyltransferase [Fluviicola taffensis]AEA42208.1 1,4-dihydroxy-2-naphtoate prenyltransferase [Fluviicola taffensis DSM 16823]
MANSSDWISALRLRTLPLSISGILVGSFIAVFQGFWNPIIFSLALSTTLLFQILSNLANDLGDSLKGADNSDRVGPMRAVQSGAISKSAMKSAVILTSVLSFISAGFLIYFGTKNLSISSVYIYIGLAIASVLAAITYTIGKKAYGYNGMGDLFVFIFFGLVSVIGVYPLFSDTLSWILIFPAITIGFLSTAVLNLNNLRDRENDEKVGKRTLVVKLGASNAKKYHYFLILSAFTSWILFLIFTKNWLGFISLIPIILFIKHLLFVSKNTVPKELDSQLKIVALGTFFISILYVISVSINQWVL